MPKVSAPQRQIDRIIPPFAAPRYQNYHLQQRIGNWHRHQGHWHAAGLASPIADAQPRGNLLADFGNPESGLVAALPP